MEQHSGDLGRADIAANIADLPTMALVPDQDLHLERSIARLAVPARLYELGELDVLYDQDQAALLQCHFTHGGW